MSGSALRSRQHWLPLTGPGEHFDLLHGGHRANVAVCTEPKNTGRSGWRERVYPHDDARAVAINLADADDLNVYQSQAGYRAERRIVAHVSAIPGAFVDLDYYNVPELVSLDAESVLDRVLAAHPWLPLPTLLFNSGRGAYFQWLFNRPLSPDLLGEWQTMQDVLVGVLEPFGSDKNAKDATRVLRVVGSINIKSGERVSGLRDIGPAVQFAAFRNGVLDHGLRELQKRAQESLGGTTPLPRELRRAVDDSGRATAAQRAQAIKPYDLAHARMLDCRTIAELRGLPMTDYRHRLLFVYGVSAAWFVQSEDRLVAELEGFAADNFADADRYGPRCAGTVIDRMRADRDGVIKVWVAAGKRVPNRYRLRNETILRYLDLTASEQRELRTIMGPEERQRRRVGRRRAAGMIDRGAQAKDRAARARELRRAGWSQAAIAAELGVQQPAVSKMLRRAGEKYS